MSVTHVDLVDGKLLCPRCDAPLVGIVVEVYYDALLEPSDDYEHVEYSTWAANDMTSTLQKVQCKGCGWSKDADKIRMEVH
jgi:hypothetical protein